MRSYCLHWRLAAILLSVLLTYDVSNAGELAGRVVAVADGDTLTLLAPGNQQVKVRLAEIDAPEKAQAFGQKSKASLSELVFDKQVRIVVQDTDRYGRKVGRVFVGTLDVNAEQVKRGFAWVYRQYAKDKSLFAHELSARAEKRGLWADSSPTAPWDFRRGSRASPSDTATTAGTFVCGAKRFCKQMTSCDEARFYLEKCGLGSLDGNKDGTPCESLCR